MDLSSFKHQHVQILAGIAALRRFAHAGIAENAERIARQVVELSSIIKMHLAVEDKVLYPSLQRSGNAELARLGQAYQDDMQALAASYLGFSRRWNTAQAVARQPELFRSDANTVLRRLHERMRQENTDFYPVVEAMRTS
ncbi:MAG: hemerythrin domain-containing protein [Alcaligenes sp.]